MKLYEIDKKTGDVTWNVGNILLTSLCFTLGVVVIFGVFYTVPVGHRGILLTWGAYAGTVDEGLHFKTPIAQSVYLMNVQTQKFEVTATAATKDLLDVTTQLALNYHIEKSVAGTLYQNVGSDYESRVVAPGIQETVKQVTAQYEAKELITKRLDVKNKIDALLAERMKGYDIIVETISITNFEFPASFNQAVLDAQTATQRAIEAENQLKTIEFQAKQVVVTAQGQADARLAVALAEAKAIQIKADALKANNQLISYNAIDKWDGHLVPFMSGADGAIPLLNIPTAIFSQVATDKTQ